MALTQHRVSNTVEAAYDELFQELDAARSKDMRPSDLERMLDQASYGLGDDYREWYELSGDPYE